MIAWGFVIVMAVIVGVAIKIYTSRAAAQRIAYDARMRAMTQTYISAARKKKAAEAAAAASAPVAESTGVVASLASPGDQRDCPFCAEPILKKAKFCKHCRRDVEPVS